MEGGGYIGKMYLMTSLEMIFVPIAFMFSPISISGEGGGYISQNQNVTLTCVQLFHSWGGGGVHQLEAKCHLDLESNFFILGGVHQPELKCHLDLRFQLFHSWGGGVHCLPILRLNMNAKESIVFMFKVHLPYTQTTGNCAISLTITNCSD